MWLLASSPPGGIDSGVCVLQAGRVAGYLCFCLWFISLYTKSPRATWGQHESLTLTATRGLVCGGTVDERRPRSLISGRSEISGWGRVHLAHISRPPPPPVTVTGLQVPTAPATAQYGRPSPTGHPLISYCLPGPEQSLFPSILLQLIKKSIRPLHSLMDFEDSEENK